MVLKELVEVCGGGKKRETREIKIKLFNMEYCIWLHL